MECPPHPFWLCLQPCRHMTSLAALRPGNASVIRRNLPYRGNSQRNRIAKIKIPTPMNNIAPSVAISASPAVLAVPLRDCDVYYPTFSFFSPSPVCGGSLPGMILNSCDSRAAGLCTLVTVKCKLTSPFFPIKLYFRHVLYSLSIQSFCQIFTFSYFFRYN